MASTAQRLETLKATGKVEELGQAAVKPAGMTEVSINDLERRANATSPWLIGGFVAGALGLLWAYKKGKF